ncbi:MAG: T9SS type A sorting domain-containing protein [Chitinophagaceae bacterium]|nr:T9SS type A sorting domain-containing protein [Chitinophagaceae bacterium]MCB9045412.1 T9SS type A sorting domain-containing protein [Chitinophagales bacterium]
MKPMLSFFVRMIIIIVIILFTHTHYSIACFKPENISVSNITQHGATVNWSNISAAYSYEFVVSTSSNLPTIKGSFTTNNNYQLQSLSANSTYCCFVRAICARGDTSDWNYICFNTPCSGLQMYNIIVTDITATTARVSWAPFQNAGSYEFVVDTSPNPPAGSGTPVSGTVTMLQGLIPDTQQCVHVRAYCTASNSFSDWSITCFGTLPAPQNVTDMTGSQNISISPNPATNQLNIKNLHGKNNISISDITGRNIYSSTTMATSESIDISHLQAGIYLVNIIAENIHFVQRIVKTSW